MKLVDLVNRGYDKVFSGNVGFNNFVVLPTFRAVEVFDTDVFNYLKISMLNNNAIFADLGARIMKSHDLNFLASSDNKRRFKKIAELLNIYDRPKLKAKDYPEAPDVYENGYNDPLAPTKAQYKGLFAADKFNANSLKDADSELEVKAGKVKADKEKAKATKEEADKAKGGAKELRRRVVL